MKKPNKKIVLLGALMASSILAYSQEAEVEPEISAAENISVEDLSEMSLEDLLNMEVSVASKRSEKLSDAPGIMTSYSDKDIENYGYYTLSDLSSITSGYSSFTAYGEKTFETRGQRAGSFDNNKHLVMYDGIPVNHARNYMAPGDYNVPLFGAKQVTFLKGPGSALYGTSAFYGVIDVAPKSLEEEGSLVQTKLSVGGYNNERRMMSNAIVKDAKGQMGVYLGYYGRNASIDNLGSDVSTHSDDRKNWDDQSSVFLNTTYEFDEGAVEGLKLGAIYMRKSGHGGDYWTGATNPTNAVIWQEMIPYLKYKKELSNKLKANTYLLYNNSVEESNYFSPWGAVNFSGVATPSSGYSYAFNNVQWTGELNYDINENHNIIGGLYYDWRSQAASPQSSEWKIQFDTTGAQIIPDYNLEVEKSEDFNTMAAYAQYQGDFDVLSGLKITSGLRYDYGVTQSNQFIQLSPRVGVVQKFTDWVNVKLLYGEAMRAPGIKEVGVNPASRSIVSDNGGNPSVIPTDLTPERIKTFEAGVTFTPTKWNIAFAYFNNKTIDALQQISFVYADDKEGPLYYKNANGETKSQGIEVDVAFALNKDLKVFANYAFADTKTNDSIQFLLVPDHKINLGVSYKLPIEQFPATISVISKNAVNYYVSSSGYDNNKTVKGYNFVDLNLQLPVKEGISLEIQTRNILDQKWYQPSISNNQDGDILYPGRTFLFTLSATL